MDNNMVHPFEHSLYDDRAEYERGSTRTDVYRVTDKTLVLFYESDERKAYVLSDYTVVWHDKQSGEDVVCKPVGVSTPSVESVVLPLLLHDEEVDTDATISVYALDVSPYVEDVISMASRKDAGALCLFTKNVSAGVGPLRKTLTTAMGMIQHMSVQTIKRYIKSAAAVDKEDVVVDDSFTPLPPSEVDDFGAEEMKHGRP